MDVANGLPNGNHDMSSMLKEMLKISGGSAENTSQVSHIGAGDAMDQMNKIPSSNLNQNPLSELEQPRSTNGDHTLTIFLKDISDGECIRLGDEESNAVIVSNVNTELESNTTPSDKIQINTVTKYEWEQRFYPGNLVTVTDKYMAYSVKVRGGYSVRVIDRQNSSVRVLLKGFTGTITDLAFSHATSSTIAAVDDSGNMLIWELDQVADSIVPELKLHLTSELEKSITHRLVWIPFVQADQSDDENSNHDQSKAENDGSVHTLVLFYGNTAEVWDLSIVYQILSQERNLKMTRAQASQAYVLVNDFKDEITDCELSPIGNVLAAASYDGSVKFWQVDITDSGSPVCLHQWQPHAGKPVTVIRFCDDKRQTEQSVYWRFLMTGCDRNIELKIWCTVTWKCLQTVKFEPPSPAHAIPEMNLLLHYGNDVVVMTDIHRKVLYIMEIEANADNGKARIASVAHYCLSGPVLSMALITAKRCRFKSLTSTKEDAIELEPEEELDSISDEEDIQPQDVLETKSNAKIDGILVELLAMQEKCLQKLNVRFVPALNSSAKKVDSEVPSNISDSSKSQSGSGQFDAVPSISATRESADGNLLNSDDELLKITEDANSQIIANASDAEEEELKPDKQNSTALKVDIITPNQSSNIQAHTPPVLLTPDAFLNSSKNSGKVPGESLNTSFTSVTPFSNITDSFYQHEHGSVSAPPNAEEPLKPKDQPNKALKTPPSSPNDPESPALPSTDPPVAVAAEILQSFCPNTVLVKSPDLISSTSTLDEGRHENASSIPVSAPPGLVRMSAPNLTESVPADVISSVLGPVNSGGAVSAWPKAPDVTMSRPHVSRSPSQAGSVHSVVSQTSRSGDDGVQVRDALSDQEHVGTSQVLSVLPKANIRKINPIKDSFALVNVGKDSTRQSEENFTDPSASQVFSHDKVLSSLKELQQQQESLLTAQQRKLDVIVKKQGQSLKQFEAASKKSDQQADRIEKSIKSFSDGQRRLNGDIKSSQSTLIDAAVSKIDRAVKAEVKRTVLPGMTGCIDEMKDQLTTSVANQLVSTDESIKETIGKHIKSKEVVDGIALVTSKKLMEQMQISIPDMFLNTVVPAFDRSCQAMFQQLSSTYHKGMDDTVKQLEKQMQFRLRSEYDRLQQITKEAVDAIAQLQTTSKSIKNDLTTNLHKEITENVEKLFSSFETRITSNVIQVIQHQQAEHQRELNVVVADVVKKTISEKLSASTSNLNVRSSSSGLQLRNDAQSSNVIDQQQQILKLILKGNYNSAFQTALTASDLNLVMFVCETVEPSAVFGVTPCPLLQPILLSLIQQLSSDLSSKTDIKLKYLQDALVNLDKKHHITQNYLHTVLSALIQNVKACLQRPLDNPTLSKDLRMLAMAAQSLMK